MLKVYLFIELLRAADPGAALSRLEALEIDNCSVRKVVQIADDKLVLYVDCKSGDDATRAVLDKIMAVDGVVQTNIIAVVHPKDG